MPSLFAILLLVLLSGAAVSELRKVRCPAPSISSSSNTIIELWGPKTIRVNSLFSPQNVVNVTGNVKSDTPLQRARYSINNGKSKFLRIASDYRDSGDGRRLAAPCDFNAEIPVSLLKPGKNKVEIEVSSGGKSHTEQKIIFSEKRTPPSIPYFIDFKSEAALGNTMLVDGKWEIDELGIVAKNPGYDRLLVLGSPNWKDYEAKILFRLTRLNEEPGPFSGAPGVGVILRFLGHAQTGPVEFNNTPPLFESAPNSIRDQLRFGFLYFRELLRQRQLPRAQPRWGYLPFGALGWLRWNDGKDAEPSLQIYRGDRDERKDFTKLPFSFDKPYYLKFQVISVASKESLYRLKAWPSQVKEPLHWQAEYLQESRVALRHGAVALVAHEADTTFESIAISTPGET